MTMRTIRALVTNVLVSILIPTPNSRASVVVSFLLLADLIQQVVAANGNFYENWSATSHVTLFSFNMSFMRIIDKTK